MKKLFTLATLSLACAITANAFTTEFSYAGDSESYYGVGVQKKESYDVAIKIDHVAYEGARVIGFKVPINATNTQINNYSGWLATDLKVANNAVVADIASKEASFNNKQLTVRFDEPYTITEEGVYIGYSFTVATLNDNTKYPVAITDGKESNALFIRTNESMPKWQDLTTQNDWVSMMSVILEMDLEGNKTIITLPAETISIKGEPTNVNATIFNLGLEAINQLEYSWTAGSLSGSKSITLDTPIPTEKNNKVVMPLEITTFEQSGNYPLTLTIDKVNGNAISNNGAFANSNISIIAFKPVKRPLVEEFTGLGCTYCPRGYVAMEQMNKYHGDMFIGLAYHCQSYEAMQLSMVVLRNNEMPISIPGFPYGAIDRKEGMDPSEFIAEWPQFASELTYADIDVVSSLDPGNIVNATATIKFAKGYENNNMKVGFAIVGDGLKNDKWIQENSYFYNKNMEGDFWDLFTGSDKKQVKGLTFNDVVVYGKDINGVKNSLPSNIEVEKEYTVSYSVNAADIVNINGKDFINPEAKLRVVAMIIDPSTGFVVNANTSDYLDTSAIEEIINEAAGVVETQYFDLLGNKVADSFRGICIKRDKLSDGSFRTQKIVKR